MTLRFDGYSLEDLESSLGSIDREKYPENYRRLLAAYREKLAATEARPGPALPERFKVTSSLETELRVEYRHWGRIGGVVVYALTPSALIRSEKILWWSRMKTVPRNRIKVVAQAKIKGAGDAPDMYVLRLRVDRARGVAKDEVDVIQDSDPACSEWLGLAIAKWAGLPYEPSIDLVTKGRS